MNKTVLIGRLTANPEIMMTANGDKIAKFTIACYRTKEVTDFIPCTAFKKSAERAEQYLHKGDQVGIEGSINTGSYTDKEGKKRYTWEVFVNSIDLIGGNKQQEHKEQSHEEQRSEQSGFVDITDDDLPF